MTAAIGSSARADLDDLRPPARREARRPRLSSAKLTMVALCAPSVFLLVLINGYPFVYAGIQSVHDGTLLTSGHTVGLTNYHTELTSDAFWAAARFTLLFTVVGGF